MEIIGHNDIRSHLAVRNYDGLIIIGYLVFVIVSIAVFYLAYSSGPGASAAEIAAATVLP